MRTFVAITTPPSGSVPKYLNECRKRLGRDRPDIKWVAGAQRHITLRFLGELSPSELPDVQVAVTRTAASCQPFEARLTGWGAFPEVSRPRTLWVGVDAPYGAFQALERELASELSVLGIPPKEKPFHPHVTLGRVRSPRGLNGLVRALKSSCPTTAGLVFTVDCVTLFEITLTAAGPEYTTLLEAPLGILNPESRILNPESHPRRYDIGQSESVGTGAQPVGKILR